MPDQGTARVLAQASALPMPPPASRADEVPSRELAVLKFPDETAGVEDLHTPPDEVHRWLCFAGGPGNERVEPPPAVLVAARRDHADAFGVEVVTGTVFVEAFDDDHGSAEGLGTVVGHLPGDCTHAFAGVAVAAYEHVHCSGLSGFVVTLLVMAFPDFVAEEQGGCQYGEDRSAGADHCSPGLGDVCPERSVFGEVHRITIVVEINRLDKRG